MSICCSNWSRSDNSWPELFLDLPPQVRRMRDNGAALCRTRGVAAVSLRVDFEKEGTAASRQLPPAKAAVGS
jgi:hypothetical protein